MCVYILSIFDSVLNSLTINNNNKNTVQTIIVRVVDSKSSLGLHSVRMGEENAM